MKNRSLAVLSVTALALAAGNALATNYNINWLDQSPTPFNSSVPTGSTFFLPGAGPVTVNYTMPAVITNSRGFGSVTSNGSVTSGPDTYSWTNHEYFGTIFTVGPDPLVPLTWRITYQFATPQPANSIVVGTLGLGATTSFGGGASTMTVLNNGAFLGDFASPNPYGPTQFTPGVGLYTVQNSLAAPGGQDPHWNTPLGVALITDNMVSSITIEVSQIRGDGIGVNIGSVVPTPGAAGLLGLATATIARRRRR